MTCTCACLGCLLLTNACNSTSFIMSYLQGLRVFQPLSTVILCTCTWLIILSCFHLQLPVLLVVTLLPATRKSASKSMRTVICTTVFMLLMCYSGNHWMNSFHFSFQTLKIPSPPSDKVELWPLPTLSELMVCNSCHAIKILLPYFSKNSV